MTTFNKQFKKLVKVTLAERQRLENQTYQDENIQVMDESAKSQYFFQDNKDIGKRYIRLELNLEISMLV